MGKAEFSCVFCLTGAARPVKVGASDILAYPPQPRDPWRDRGLPTANPDARARQRTARIDPRLGVPGHRRPALRLMGLRFSFRPWLRPTLMTEAVR